MISNRTIKLPAAATFFLLLLISVAVTYLIATQGVLTGVIVLLVSVGVVLLAAILKDYRIGFYFIFLMGVFMFYIDRLVYVPFPMGTLYDALIGLVFFSLIVDRKELNWTGFKNPITIIFVIVIVYQMLQFFNPSATSPVAWVVSLRNNISFLVYVICFHMFSSLKEVKRFTWVWLGIAMLTGLYGIYQKMFGLTSFESAWLNASPDVAKLYVLFGQLRVFSFLSDPSIYGLYTGAAALSTMVLAMGPFKLGYRILFGVATIILLVAMSYSGTRTAIALVAVGIAFYVTIMLHNRRTFIAGMGVVFLGLILLFGPFYGGTMSRLRSTFKASDDPSMAVRDYKRLMFQDYIQTHPIGGGLYTVGHNGERYSPGHPLAGKWDTDSGYLLTALETGWIGLLIFLGLFFAVMLKGINNFFSMNDPVLRTYMLVYIVPFLALSVAHFTQDAMFSKPTNVVIYATYALVIKIATLEKKLYSVDLV
ncbi:MAG TPA: O-antigen ligase family protein [Chryseosolibacter sp.]|nr:O-antigen ligase family protein [Chryseosolibacter sp.]